MRMLQRLFDVRGLFAGFVVCVLFSVLASGCVTRPETPRERIAAAQLVLQTVYGTAADVKARGKLSVSSEVKILAAGADAQLAIDLARTRLTGLGDDPKLLDIAIRAMEARLLALERIASEEGVK
jgi:hypothetical protein